MVGVGAGAADTAGVGSKVDGVSCSVSMRGKAFAVLAGGGVTSF